MDIDRRAFIASLGGTAAVGLMDSEAKADALEHWMEDQLDQQAAAQGTPESFQLSPSSKRNRNAQLPPRHRQCLREHARQRQEARADAEESDAPGLLPAAVRPGQSRAAERDARPKTGMSEEIILACLLHDCAQALMKADHGWWGAQLFEPYIPEKSTFGIRYHQALRFYADADAGYEYPDLYYRIFGQDYVPPPHIEATYKMLRNHKWYMEPRLVTVNDLYAFDPNAKVSIDPFETSSAATSSSRRKASVTTTARARTCGARWPIQTRRSRSTASGLAAGLRDASACWPAAVVARPGQTHQLQRPRDHGRRRRARVERRR